jgi:hypothetical protein
MREIFEANFALKKSLTRVADRPPRAK